MSTEHTSDASVGPTQRPSAGGDVWVRRASALVVAGVAAYSSYAHQRHFALAGGADPVSAALWPLSVDGLVILATLGLMRTNSSTGARAKATLWMAFSLGIAVSLAANVAAAPSLSWQSILVAGWPPLALLLAVELVVHSRGRAVEAETVSRASEADGDTETTVRATEGETCETAGSPAAATESVVNGRPVDVSVADITPRGRLTAEEIMWSHFEAERRAGRTPSGAELDRVAGTNNYGRAVVARWRRTGRIPAAAP